jgi:glycosyltransferase involved in cell wall biosynthesis
MRRLLLITYHFPPSAAAGSFRILGFARHLPKFAWQTVVVAPPRMPREPVDPALSAQVPPETEVIHVPFPQGRRARLLSRMAPHGIWLPRALRACLRLVRTQPPDAVLTSGPPHCIHLLGLVLKRRYQLPWLIDLRDPWRHRNKPLSLLNRSWEAFMERRIMKRADMVITNAPIACSTLQSAFPQYKDKIHTITNGYDPGTLPAALMPPRLPGTVSMVHTGEIYEGRDPLAFLDAVKDLFGIPQNGHRPLHITFLGRNNNGSCNLRQEVRQRRLDSLVEVGGQVEYNQSLEHMARAHILLLLDAPGRRAGVPAKLYEYIGTGRPVLALAEPDSDVAWVLRESGITHRIARPNCPAEIRAALAELLQVVAGEPFDPPAPQNLFRFTREYMARQLAELLSPGATRTEPVFVPAGSLADD